MNKKIIYLFLALVLPGLIFVFLKKFGKNEFQVPVYFETGLPADSICQVVSSGAYHLPDSIMNTIDMGQPAMLRVIIVYPFVKEDFSEVNRIMEKYASDSVRAVVLSGVPNHPKSKFRQVFLNFNDFGNFIWCWLRVQEPWSVVVVDKKNQIRGYYNGTQREEMDRLDMELSILLKKY